VAVAGHDDVGRLDIAMDDAFGASGFEGVGNLNAEVEHLVVGYGLFCDELLQGVAFEQFHGDERDFFASVVHHVNFVDGADVGMIQG
jgi:hypothetical protein